MENLVSPTSIIQTFCLVPAGSDNQGWTTTLSEHTLEVEVFSVGAAGFLHAHCYSKCGFSSSVVFGHVFTTCGCSVWRCMVITADYCIGSLQVLQAKTCLMQESISLLYK